VKFQYNHSGQSLLEIADSHIRAQEAQLFAHFIGRGKKWSPFTVIIQKVRRKLQISEVHKPQLVGSLAKKFPMIVSCILLEISSGLGQIQHSTNCTLYQFGKTKTSCWQFHALLLDDKISTEKWNLEQTLGLTPQLNMVHWTRVAT